MDGVLYKQGNKIIFRNMHEMSTEIDENTVIGLNILEEIYE